MVSIYIEAQVEYKPNKMIKNRIFIDSGADMCLAKRFVKPLETKEAPKECKCWNCNEKGHYANKCPKLKKQGIKYINTTQFIMSLEQLKENDKTWYSDEEFYISQTEDESEIEIKNNKFINTNEEECL